MVINNPGKNHRCEVFKTTLNGPELVHTHFDNSLCTIIWKFGIRRSTNEETQNIIYTLLNTQLFSCNRQRDAIATTRWHNTEHKHFDTTPIDSVFLLTRLFLVTRQESIYSSSRVDRPPNNLFNLLQVQGRHGSCKKQVNVWSNKICNYFFYIIAFSVSVFFIF